MGAIYCDIHGVTSSVIGCKHINDYFKEIYSGQSKKPALTFKSVTLTRLPFIGTLRIGMDCCYCNICSEELGFHERSFSNIFYLITNPINIYRFIKYNQSTCLSCLLENFWEVKNAGVDYYLSILNTTKTIPQIR